MKGPTPRSETPGSETRDESLKRKARNEREAVEKVMCDDAQRGGDGEVRGTMRDRLDTGSEVRTLSEVQLPQPTCSSVSQGS